MACTVNYNKNKKIDSVLTAQGERSKLFDQLAKLPHMESLEQALETYKNIYSSDFSDVLGEPPLSFKSDRGNNFKSFKEALVDSSGGDIEIKVGDKTLLVASSNTNVKTLGGFINNNIKAGILSDERIVDQGESFLKAEGYDEARQMVNEVYLKEEAVVNLGGGSIKISRDGKITLQDKKETEKAEDEVSEKMNNALKDILNKKTNRVQDVSENTLQLKLLDLLNKMGVQVMSISDYVEKYKIRNGVEPTAEALADIANQVVAFKDGLIPLEMLSEETAHFIVEAWNEQEIENLLRNVDKTDSYVEYAAQYREIYKRENPSKSEAEIEALVRREVLGKELAKAIQNSFNTENKTEVQKSILRKLYDLLINFFQSVKTNEAFYKDLSILTTKVQDLLITQDVEGYLNTNNFKNKKFRMYSAKSGNINIDSIRDLAQVTIKTLLDQEKELRRAKKGSKASVEQLKEIERKLMNNMDKAFLSKAVAEILSLGQRQVNYIQEALNSATKRAETLSNEESLVLYQLTNQTLPAIGRMQDVVKSANDPLFSRIPSAIKDVTDAIVSLKGRVDNTETDILERVLDRVMSRNQLPDTITKADGTVRNVRQEMLDALKTAEKDTNMLFAYYGQLTHARDPLLNMLGSVIGDIFTNAEQRHLKRAKTFQKFMADNKYKPQDFKDFIDGKWLVSLWDFRKFEETERDIRIKALKDVGVTLSEEELKNKDVFLEALKSLDDKQNSQYQEIAAKNINKERENAFEDKYYEDREKELAKYSQYTRDQLRILSVQRGEIASRATVVDGRVRYNYADRINLDYLNLKRRGMKSLFNRDGSLKVGLDPDVDGSIEVSGIKYSLRPGASDEARLAFEMHQIDQKFMDDLKAKGETLNKGLAASFEDELAKITDEEEAKEFFLMNVNIAFSDEFWEGMEGSKSFLDRAEEVVQGNSDLQDILTKYKNKVAQRSAILKQFRDTRDATNTLANEMDEDIKKQVLILSDEIDEYARVFTAQKNFEESENNLEAESKPNRAYYGKLSDENITTTEEILKFAMENMTPSNIRKVREFNEALDDLNKSKVLTGRQEKIIQRITGFDPYSIDLNDIDSLKIANAESKLASYYKAFSPKGLTESMQNLENGNKTVKETVEDLKNNPNVKLSNHFSYYEKTEIANRNKNKIENFDGGYIQPRLYDNNGQEKYINSKFVSLFNPKKENGRIVVDENGDIIPTTNVDKYKLYKEILNFQKESLKSYGEEGRHNAFLAPQVSKQLFEEIDAFAKKNNKGQVVKEWWRDIAKFRADELATGAEIDGKSLFKGAGVKVIPKYYLNLLEDEAAVSQDLFYTLMAMGQQAELYKARQEKFSEVVVLQDTLERRQYIQGKKIESTSTYKIFQNYMNGAIFGIREMREARVTLPFFGEVNLTKVIDFLHKMLKHKSLSVNFIIPATSWLTAEGTLLVEKWIGQYVDKDSYTRARRELKKLSKGAMKDSIEIDSTAKMSILGEYYGVFDLDAKFANSMYSKTQRFFGRAGYILHTVGNFTPISKSVLANLYGHRIYGDRLVDFKKFKELEMKSGKSAKTIEADWTALESKSLYSYIAIDKNTNTMSYDYDRIAKDMGTVNDETFQENFRNMELGVTSKIKKLVELIDGQIRPEERTLLQRDILGRFITTHSAWLLIAASRRFKGRHYSLQTGMEEEGTYVSLGKFLTRALNGLSKDKMKAFKEAYKEADEVEKENLLRIAKEVAFLQAIFAVGLAYGIFADDDENKDSITIQGTAYLLDRVINETSSSQLGLMGEFYKKAESPITGLSSVKDMLSLANLGDFSEIERGSYKGMTHFQKYLVQNIPGIKSARDISNGVNLKNARDKYSFYNDTQENFIFLNYLLSEDMLKEK